MPAIALSISKVFCSAVFGLTAVAVLLPTLPFSLASAQNAPVQTFSDHDFETQIRPLLAGKCLGCHGERRQEGGLRLDAREHLLEGGDSGPAVVPSDTAQSLLMLAVRRQGPEMPLTKA